MNSVAGEQQRQPQDAWEEQGWRIEGSGNRGKAAAKRPRADSTYPETRDQRQGGIHPETRDRRQKSIHSETRDQRQGSTHPETRDRRQRSIHPITRYEEQENMNPGEELSVTGTFHSAAARTVRGNCHTQQGQKYAAHTEKRRKKISRKERQRIRKIRRMVFLTGQCGFFLIIILLLLNIKKQLHNNTDIIPAAAQGQGEVSKAQNGVPEVLKGRDTADYPDLCGLNRVDRPVKRETYEVLEKLQELAKENELISGILQNTDSYPDNMLEALANNPEMADFVSGYLTADKKADPTLTESEKKKDFPLFLQWDPRWGYASYGDNSNIGLAGCGPVSLSMALYYLTGDETLTPNRIASYSMKNGYYMSGTGTAWALMKDLPPEYGIRVTQPGISESIIRRELDAGHMIICAMRPGDFTAAGHFIVIYGYDENGLKVNDPNCVARSRQSWPFDRLKSQIKNLWSFSA